MDPPDGGYSHALQFVLQFLHTEGFHGAEDSLMTELEQRLPALLDLEKGSPGSSDRTAEPSGLFSPQSAPGAPEGLESELDLLGSLAQDAKEGRSRSAGAQAGEPFLSARDNRLQAGVGRLPSVMTGPGPLGRNWWQRGLADDPKLLRMQTFPPSSSQIMAMRGRDDEYSDEEDVGYVRIDIYDQEAFIASEIDEPAGSTGGLEISGSDDDRSTESDAGTDMQNSDNIMDSKTSRWRAAGPALNGDDENLSNASGDSSGSSRNSSYFSGELSPELSTLTSSADPAEFGLGSNIEFEVARQQIAQSPPLPPADSEQEIFVMGLSSDSIDQLSTEPATKQSIAENPLSLSSDGDQQVSATPDPALSPTQDVDLAFAVNLSVITPAAEGSSEVGARSISDEQDNSSAEGTSTRSDVPAEGGNGLDFAFPVTPSAEDPAVVFSTWSNLRSRSVSNASDYSGHDFGLLPSGSSPYQGSPERGFSGNIVQLEGRDQDPNALASEAHQPTGKSEMQSPLFSALNTMSANEHDRWQGQPEAEQVLEFLSALENPDGNQTQYGSYGSHQTQESPRGFPSPPASQSDLWTTVTGQQASAAPETEEAESSDHDEGVADGQITIDTTTLAGPEVAAENEPAPEQAGGSSDVVGEISGAEEEQKNDMVVMQYDAEEVNRKYEVFNLQIVHRRNHTGFEETKDFPIRLNDCIAGRYQVLDFLGSAAFSRAVQALDLKTGMLVCLKIIKNNKDYFDQSLDEIKLLKYINDADPDDAAGVLRLFDYFYYKEHLFIVCELLRANLYEFQKYNRESGDEPYFSLPRLQAISRQVLQSLAFLHGLNLIHSDLKPENILIKSYSRCEVKVIDLGSSCFTTDHLSSYVQSRSYRAPEVILGLPYDQRIDIWSLGCILSELASGYVLFQNDSLSTLLARLVGILGPIPKQMLKTGRYAHRFFTRSGHPYERSQTSGEYQILRPKATTLAARIPQGDATFLDFLQHLLTIDPGERPSAEKALQHPWLQQEYGDHPDAS